MSVIWDQGSAIREMKGRQQGTLTMSPGDRITGVDVETYKDR